jgi:hypothetical protein
MGVIYERKGLCPYTNVCESFKTMLNSERWMQKALIQLRREGADSFSRAEGGYTVHTLQDRLEHLRKVRMRCYNHHGRCLRFWQFEKKNEDAKSISLFKRRLEMKERASTPIPLQQQAPESQE